MNWKLNPLPSLNIEPGVRNGRNPFEGYQRGWSLQFGGFFEKAEGEALFKHALSNIGVQTYVSPVKRLNLYLLITRFLNCLESQNIIEFGAFQGGNSLFMALLLAEIAPKAKVYALDTYRGMPETDKSIDAHTVGDFSSASLETLNRRIAELKLDNLIPVEGLFQETYPTISEGMSFGLAHIDADIYSAVKFAQDAVWPQMTKGGYIVYDDAEVSSCIGATQAVEELIIERRLHCEQIWPHFVFRAKLD